MEFKVTLHTTMILAALFAIPGLLAAQQEPSKVGKKTGAMDVRTLLEKGRASGSLPEGMVIRIAACLGELTLAGSGDRLPEVP